MTALRGLAFLLLAIAFAAGLRPWDSAPVPESVEGYYVLAADFHVHSFPGDWATLAPWDDIREARRAHLDVIALTSHNSVWSGQVGQWLASVLNGPIVLEGEEIHAPHYHLLAVGIRSSIDWRKSAEEAIAEIHAQGGMAIAAHPVAQFWPGYDAAAIRGLDGAEVLHPTAYESTRRAAELHEFFARGHFAAIGDSDFRGLGRIGVCRTFVFARERSEQGVLQAIRERHTVVLDRGQYFGDAALIELAKRSPQVEEGIPLSGNESALAVARLAGAAGLLLAIVVAPWRSRR